MATDIYLADRNTSIIIEYQYQNIETMESEVKNIALITWK